MNRSKDVSGLAAACVLALAAALAGCAQRDPTSAANPPAAFGTPHVIVEAAGGASDRTSAVYDEPRAAVADLPVVVITGHRRLVLSERNFNSSRD
ncbi:MAG TPA: hypothetical protein VN750_12070 [Steroidobacteraceae bacterium]|nr:hypothetical protein [Steroidobacteraceae bacterium]